MAVKNDQNITISSRTRFLNELTLRIKLIARLVADRRVSPFAKILPIGALVYLIFPDLIPTPVDDALLLWLSSYLFVELCPPEVVEEHMNALKKSIPGGWKDPDQGEDEIIDAEYWERP
ncbi:MAG: hypothetical protein GX495_19860 [Chloroflexi bacterium]|jgi:hypothetical protein|nr:hypothetical protein [Chloroflexota bacterium]